MCSSDLHGGKVTIAQIAAEVGAPTGSIYHRFPFRDHLLIRLWLRAIRRFHMGLLAAPDITATSRHIPQFCRNHPIDAQVMTLFWHADLIATAPVELRNEVFHVNDSAWAKCRDLTSRVLRHHVAGTGRTHESGHLLVPLFTGAALYWSAHSTVA